MGCTAHYVNRWIILKLFSKQCKKHVLAYEYISSKGSSAKKKCNAKKSKTYLRQIDIWHTQKLFIGCVAVLYIIHILAYRINKLWHIKINNRMTHSSLNSINCYLLNQWWLQICLTTIEIFPNYSHYNTIYNSSSWPLRNSLKCGNK